MAILIPLTIPTVTVTVLVLSAVAAAVMFTEAPDGSEAGAVKTVAIPEAVCAGLNEPHFAALQLTAQSTPWFVESFATVAMICDCPLVGIVDAGTWLNDTVIVLGGV
jgi:hypothetical protein